MFVQEKELYDQTSLVLKNTNKIKIQSSTDYLQNVKKEISLCENSVTRNFVSFAKENSLNTIKDAIEKASNAVLCKGTYLIVCLSFSVRLDSY